jgi:hypothetical protein
MNDLHQRVTFLPTSLTFFAGLTLTIKTRNMTTFLSIPTQDASRAGYPVTPPPKMTSKILLG